MDSRLKGRRPTKPVPALDITPERKYADGWALFDQLQAARQAAYGANRRRPEDMPILPNGNRDGSIQDDDPVTIPYWAFDATCRLVLDALTSNARGMRNYRTDMIHWHRYTLCRQALRDGRGKWPPKEPDVYEVVSNELVGTAFAARRDGIQKSFDVVNKALKRGEHKRFYRSTAFHLYDWLLNTPGPIFFVC